MVTNKRKKNTRQRGSKTYGWGKVHRGAGSRGGVGRSGTGKRGDQKKPSFWGQDYFGMHGLKSKKKKDKTINIQTIELKLYNWLKEEKIEKKGEMFVIDLDKMGYDKLLSKGLVKSKLEINVKQCSKNSEEKIVKAGGKINIIKKNKKELQKQEKTAETSKIKKDRSKKERKKEEE